MTFTKKTFGIAIFAVILGKHFSTKLQQKWLGRGTDNSTNEEIAIWAIDFYDNYKNRYCWKRIENGIKPLSNHCCTIDNLEDALVDFGYYKLNQS